MTEVRPRRSEARWWLGLMWGEWFTHARLLLFFLVAWLAAFWLIPLVAHPLWILMVGIAYALATGPAFGGANTMDGCEEFSFALPATRRQRFLGEKPREPHRGSVGLWVGVCGCVEKSD